MRRILAISPDAAFLRALRWRLEEAGYVVLLSDSLERSFYEVDQSDPFLVIVDADALTNKLWEARQFLAWFHHRSAVLLLADRQGQIREAPCDCCLPKTVETEQLLTWIRNLRR